MDGHLPALRVRLGDQLAADGACQEALLHAHQLRHPLHGGGQLLPQAEELVPVDGGPVGVHRGDLNTRGGRGVGLVGSNRIPKSKRPDPDSLSYVMHTLIMSKLT